MDVHDVRRGRGLRRQPRRLLGGGSLFGKPLLLGQHERNAFLLLAAQQEDNQQQRQEQRHAGDCRVNRPGRQAHDRRHLARAAAGHGDIALIEREGHDGDLLRLHIRGDARRGGGEMDKAGGILQVHLGAVDRDGHGQIGDGARRGLPLDVVVGDVVLDLAGADPLPLVAGELVGIGDVFVDLSVGGGTHRAAGCLIVVEDRGIVPDLRADDAPAVAGAVLRPGGFVVDGGLAVGTGHVHGAVDAHLHVVQPEVGDKDVHDAVAHLLVDLRLQRQLALHGLIQHIRKVRLGVVAVARAVLHGDVADGQALFGAGHQTLNGGHLLLGEGLAALHLDKDARRRLCDILVEYVPVILSRGDNHVGVADAVKKADGGGEGVLQIVKRQLLPVCRRGQGADVVEIGVVAVA